LTLSINRITKEISKDAVQISELAFPVPNGYLLIFGEFFGWLFSTAILLRNTLINLPSVINEKIYISFNELKKGFIRYIKFPKYGVLTTLINNLASQMSIFFLTLYFSKSDAGQFAISNNLLRAPLTFIGNSIGQVFYQRASTIRKDRVQLENLVEQTFNKLLNLSIMPIIFLLIFGKEFIIIFLGNQWGTAGVFTQILAPWILFVFISVPISTLVSINEKQEIGLLFNILLLVTRFLTLYIGYLFKNIILGLILFSITGALLYGALSIWLCTSVGVKLKTLTNNIVKTIFKMIPYVVLLTILKLVNFSDLIKLILAVIISAINFYLFFRKEPIFISFSEAIINKIKKKNN
jgi:O-antigen/teichoic acid export membrane protein